LQSEALRERPISDPNGTGFVDCAEALAELIAATATVTGRVADIEANGGKPDAGHVKALQQALKRMNNALRTVQNHCACELEAAAAIAAAAAAAAAAAEAIAPYIALGAIAA